MPPPPPRLARCHALELRGGALLARLEAGSEGQVQSVAVLVESVRLKRGCVAAPHTGQMRHLVRRVPVARRALALAGALSLPLAITHVLGASNARVEIPDLSGWERVAIFIDAVGIGERALRRVASCLAGAHCCALCRVGVTPHDFLTLHTARRRTVEVRDVGGQDDGRGLRREDEHEHHLWMTACEGKVPRVGGCAASRSTIITRARAWVDAGRASATSAPSTHLNRPASAHSRASILHVLFWAPSYYNRTGGNDDDERPINGHTAAHPATASELCIF
jgi:hypothetical protein